MVDCFKLDGHSVFSSGTVADLLQKVCHVSPGKDNKENVQLLLLDPTTQLSHYILRLQVVQLFYSIHQVSEVFQAVSENACHPGLSSFTFGWLLVSCTETFRLSVHLSILLSVCVVLSSYLANDILLGFMLF